MAVVQMSETVQVSLKPGWKQNDHLPLVSHAGTEVILAQSHLGSDTTLLQLSQRVVSSVLVCVFLAPCF